MISLRRAGERHLERHHDQECWLSFYPRDRADPRADHFGALESLSERRLPPNAVVSRTTHHYAEILTYVREGALAYEDGPGHSGVIETGEFQATAAGSGIRRSEKNGSRAHWAQVFQLLLGPTRPGVAQGHQQQRFSTAQRRGKLCVVASADAREGSLRLHQDALMCSALLEPGQHVVHELAPGRTAWLHLVAGEVAVGDFVLAAGDGLGVTAERAVSVTAQSRAEILLLDLAEAPSKPGGRKAQHS